MTLTDPQMRAATFVPIPGALLSITGSSYILYMLVREKKHSPYRRLLFVMSLCDILSSATFVLLPILVPAETSQWVYAIGNDMSCNFIGTMVQLSFSNFWYAGMLSVYFFLSVVVGLKEHTIAVCFEPWMHFIALGCKSTRISSFVFAGSGMDDRSYTYFMYTGPFFSAVYVTASELINELVIGPGCWIASGQKICREGTETCDIERVAWIVAGYPMLFMLLLIALCNIMIVWAVKRTFVRSSDANTSSTRNAARIRAVASQALLYVLAFAASWIFSLWLRLSSTRRVATEEEEGTYFPLIILQAIFAPLQGFFNFLVALRPKYSQLRDDYPLESQLWCVRRALYGDDVQPTQKVDEKPSEENNSSSDVLEISIRKKTTTNTVTQDGHSLSLGL